MKRILSLIALSLISFIGFSQTKGISYQAVIIDPNPIEIPGKDITAQPYVSKDVWIRFGIYSGATLQYEELHKTKTDEYGLVNLVIGAGVNTGKAGTFTSLSWDGVTKNIITNVSFDQGGRYTEVSNQKLTYVPYSLLSETAVKLAGVLPVNQGGTGATNAIAARTNLGLGNVDNTADVDKPVSIATLAILDTKEAISNKSTNIIADSASSVKYPSVKAIKDYIDSRNSASANSARLAAKATALETPRTINGVPFDGTANITIPVGVTPPDADATTKGLVQLAGDLSGTAASPAIAANAVSTAKIADGAVTTGKLAAGAVTTAKVADGAITDAKITSVAGSKVTGNIAGNAGTATKLAAPKNINGVPFDGTSDITISANASTLSGTIAIANGGTGATTAAGARTNLGLVIGTDVLAQRTFGTAANSAASDFVAATEKGANNGVATLGVNGKIPSTQIPAISFQNVNVVNSDASMTAIAGAQVGSIAIRTDNNNNYVLSALPASTLSNWIALATPLYVSTVNGYAGPNVSLTTNDVPEGTTNKYYTDARVRNAITATGPLNFNASTGVLSMTTASTTSGGFLTASDFTNFNNKQTALTAGVDYATPGGNITGNAANVTGIVSIANGGTGTSTATGALLTLGAEPSANKSNDILVDGNSTTKFPTFKAIKDYVDQQSANAGVADNSITSAKIFGTLAVLKGGTGASTAAGARTNLGLAIGTDVMAANFTTTLTGDVTGSGNGSFATTVNSVGGVTASTIAGLPTSVAANTASITANIASILLKAPIASPAFTGTPTAPTPTTSDNSTKVATTEYVKSNLATVSAGTLTGTTLASTITGSSLTSVGTITSGVWSATEIAIANGGTGATTAAGARTNLGLGSLALKSSIANADVASGAAIDFTKLNITKADITGLGIQEGLTAGSGISITSGTISATGLTAANLSSSAGIMNAQLANSSTTLGSTTMSLGGTVTSVTGLTTLEATNLTGTLSGTATTATNLAGGVSGSIPYQTGAGTTAMIPVGSANQFLTSTGSGTYTWTSTSAVTGNYVPYTGATGAVNLGAYDLTVNGLTVGKGGGAKSDNTVLGVNALLVNTTGNYSTAVGTNALKNSTNGANTAFGNTSLYQLTTGISNTAIGYNTLSSATTQNSNTAVGDQSMRKNTGSFNTALGTYSLYGNTIGTMATGDFNTGIGYLTLQNATTAAYNAALGSKALSNLTTGNDNTVIGYNSGALSGTATGTALTSANQSILIGSGVRAGTNTTTNEIVIGYQAVGNGSNTVTIGNASTTSNYFKGDINLTGNVNGGTWSGTTIGSNYGGAGSVNGLLKANGSGVVSAAVAGTDFMAANATTTLTGDVTGSGNGSFATTINSVGGVSSSTISGFNARITTNTNDIALRATIASPSFTGTPTAPTPTTGDNSTKIATTEYVQASITAASAGISSVGPISATANANGATISGSSQLILTPASASFGGVVTTAAQTFAGAKTFSNTATFNSDITVNGIKIGLGNNAVSTNTGVGYGTLGAVTSQGSDLTALGYNALTSNTSGYGNTAIGQNSLLLNTTGFYNTAVGKSALSSNVQGQGNFAGGMEALKANTSGHQNTSVGSYSLNSNTTGGSNTALGYWSLRNLYSSSGNTALGTKAGEKFGSGTGTNLTAATNGVFLGSNTRPSANSSDNEVVIGADAVGNGSNTVTVGNLSNTATFFTGNINLTGNVVGGTWSGTTIGSNYGGAGSINGILKANGSGVVSAAISGTDFQAPLTAGSGISIASGTISATGLTSANLSSTAGITNSQLANSSTTLGSTTMTLGGTVTSVTGLTSLAATNLTGTLSGTATSLATGRTIALTGDVTYTSPAFDGSGDVTAAATLAASGVASGTYGSSTAIPVLTVDTKGRVTSASTVGIIAGVNSLNYTSTTSYASGGTISGTSLTLAAADGTNPGLISTGAQTFAGAKTFSADVTAPNFLGNATTATTAGNITATSNTTLTSLVNLATVGTITSGIWSATEVAIAKGGTGATTASGARTNLGLTIGTDVMAANFTTTLTGDVTGAGNGSFATTLAASGVASGTYGSSTTIPVLTVDTKGRITTASTVSIVAGVNTVTAIAATSNANGATISGTALTLTPADASNGGVVTTVAQTFAGVKTFSSAVTASSNLARGTIFSPTLTATADNDILTGVDISPTFTNGAFLNVANYGLRVQGIHFGRGGGNIANNTALGTDALKKNSSSGGSNTAFGWSSLAGNTDGGNNTAVGKSSLGSNATGSDNTAVGAIALTNNTAGNNTAVGSNSLNANTSGTQNTSVGSYALSSNTTGNYNVSIGGNANNTNQTGSNNIAIGYQSLYANSVKNSTSDNVAIGYQSMGNSPSGSSNTVIGTQSNYSNTTGANNTALGWKALYYNATGTNNTALGYYAGNTTTTNVLTNGIYLGYYAAPKAATSTDEIVIGSNLTGNGSNTVTIGNASNTANYLRGILNVNAGTATATTNGLSTVLTAQNAGTGNQNGGNITLTPGTATGTGTAGIVQINGQVQITGGSPGAGEVLTSDANGLATWATPTGVTSIGAISGTATSTGATITSGVLNLTPADATNGGIVNTISQTFAGSKTFSSDISVNGNRVGAGTGTGSAYNSAFGVTALGQNTSGNYNVAIGGQALFSNTTGTNNTAIGYGGLGSNTTGSYNAALGYYAGENIRSSNNVAIGNSALRYARSDNNIAIGSYAGGNLGYVSVTGGVNNIFLGYQAGNSFGSASGSNTRGLNSVYIGYDVRAAADNETNEVVIAGYNGTAGTVGLGNNTTLIGNNATQKSQIYGALTVVPNAAPTTTDGNSILLQAQNAGTGGNNNGGNITLTPGTATGTGTAGQVIVTGGDMLVNTLTIGLGKGARPTNTALGYTALASNTTSSENVAVGYSSLYTNTTGSYNTAVGYKSMMFNTTGYSNTAHGDMAMYSNTTGNDNTGIGLNALYKNTSGTNNTGVGSNSMYSNTTGKYNTSLGFNALYTNATSDQNTAVGYEALKNTTSANNTAVGYSVLSGNSTGTANTGMGNLALGSNTTGSNNAAFGAVALRYVTTGSDNVAFGQSAGANSTGSQNVFIGSNSGLSSTSVSNNIFLGFKAGQYYGTLSNTSNTTGDGNIMIGTDVRPLADGQTNQIVIAGYTGSGAGMTGNGSNTVTIGNTSNTANYLRGILNVTAGTAASATNGLSSVITAQNAGAGNQNGGNITLTPGTATGTGTAGIVQINGQVQITGGSPGAGEVLTSNASGLATWSYSIGSAVVTSTTTYAITLAESVVFYTGTAAGAFTIPAAASTNAGKEITIKNKTAFGITVTPASGTIYIDNANASAANVSIGIEASNNWIKLVSDGTQWNVIRALF